MFLCSIMSIISMIAVFIFSLIIGSIIGVLTIILERKKSNEIIEKEEKGKYNFIPKYRTCAYLLTQTELDFYKQLSKVIPEEKGISFKVRLCDILKPNTYGFDYKVSINKVMPLHIDFVIFNKENFFIDMAIELDDLSHGNEKSLKNDEFKNKAFESANLPLHRITVEQDYSQQLAKIFPKEETTQDEEEKKRKKAYYARKYYAQKNTK